MNRRLSDTEECLSDLEERIMQIIQSEQQKENQIFKNKNILRDLWENNKNTNICIIEDP